MSEAVIPERWRECYESSPHGIHTLVERQLMEELGATSSALDEARKQLKPFTDAIRNNGEYMDADGLIKAFIYEQERLQQLVAQQADTISQLCEAFREVIAISDRKTDVWDRAKAVLASIPTQEPTNG